MRKMENQSKIKAFLEILAGLITYSIVGLLGLYLLRASWADYPAWYHFAYLLPIIPTIWLSSHFFHKQK